MFLCQKVKDIDFKSISSTQFNKQLHEQVYPPGTPPHPRMSMYLPHLRKVSILPLRNLMTDELVNFRNNELLRHNVYRSNHNTTNLTLDEDLSNAAQEWASYLAESNAFEESASGHGENLYSENCTQNCEYRYGAASDAWYAEGDNWNYTAAEPMGESTTGNFTQMMWKNTTRVGFGVESYKVGSFEEYFVVAFYKVAGNREGEYSSNVLPPFWH